MDQQNAEKLLDVTFGHNFDINQFSKFIKELFNKFEISQVKINISKDNKEYRGYIDSYQILGTYKDESNKNIDVLAVQLIKESSRDRARTMQRNFIADYIEVKKKDAVLVAFYGDDPQDWRFSFVKMEYQLTNDGRVQKKLTPAKRHSFLVGKNEPNHTCKSRFLNLIMREDINPSLNELEEAFSIENVTKEFFLKYKGLFYDLRDSLKNIIKKNQYVEKEFTEKNISPDDFSKKLLGQIIFLYFLQKKGWLGVERDSNTGKFKEWGSGHKDFLTKLVNGEIIDYEKNDNHNKNFFNDILEPLFYSALATPRENDYYEIFDYKCKIPFLNGGLFEPINNYNWQEIDILLDNQIYKDIINTFDEFNFTVKEDEPLDKEVAVDPEMLGKVFENLLEVPDRKSKGTYYTPREIVHYMCQQSLITYLATNSAIPSKDIETFIQNGDIAYIGKSENDEKCLPGTIKDNLEKIDELLKKIKIVDPAVGSGAFPMGMMNEIVKARKTISLFLKKNVFCWDDVPGKDSNKLIDFLIQTFGVDWIENAKIDKIDNNKTICIISEAFSNSVTINLEGNYAFLTLDDGRNDAFIVKKENGLENIYYAKIGNSYDLKRETIENCLYGVDIDSSAVDIAKLRFWLSLVVDETDINKIKPLPNLDHKIMCGNSLLEEFEGVKLFDEKFLEEIPKDDTSRIEQINREMDELHQELGEIYTGKKKDNGRKSEIEKELKKLERKKREIPSMVKEETQQYTIDQAFQNRSKESHRKLVELRKLQQDFFNEESKKTKKELADKIDKIEWEFIEETLKEQGNEAAMQKLQQYKKNKSKPFFLWKLNFSEVFQRENPGFDVVIANPPYLEARSPKFTDEMKDDLQQSLTNEIPGENHLISRGSDLLVYFYVKSIKLIRKDGFIAFITQNSWLDTDYGKKFQKFLIKNTNIKSIIDSDYKHFDTANINTVITFFKGNKKSLHDKNKCFFLNYHISFDKCRYNFSQFEELKDNMEGITCKIFDQNTLDSLGFKWGLLLYSDEELLEIINILSSKGIKLDKINDAIVTCGQGVNLTKNYMVDNKITTVVSKASLIPIMYNKDGAPYSLKKTSSHLIDKYKINNSEFNELTRLGIKVFDSNSTNRMIPTIILPRGVSRHFASMNLVGAYSASGVEIYIKSNDKEKIEQISKRLWVFLNSSLLWLLREVSGRKNLGGGMLKAEATDLKEFELYFNFDYNLCNSIYYKLHEREVLPTIEEIRTSEHKVLDQIVFDYLCLGIDHRQYIMKKLEDVITRRESKASN